MHVCVLRVEELISVQPPTSCSGGGARSELFIPHGGSRFWVSVRSGPCCLWMLGFHKKELATGGADIHEELARAKLELTGLEGRRRRRKCASSEWKEKTRACVWVRGGLEGMKERGVFERKCLRLTWPWGPIMGLLGLCGGGCAWGDC